MPAQRACEREDEREVVNSCVCVRITSNKFNLLTVGSGSANVVLDVGLRARARTDCGV